MSESVCSSVLTHALSDGFRGKRLLASVGLEATVFISVHHGQVHSFIPLHPRIKTLANRTVSTRCIPTARGLWTVQLLQMEKSVTLSDIITEEIGVRNWVYYGIYERIVLLILTRQSVRK